MIGNLETAKIVNEYHFTRDSAGLEIEFLGEGCSRSAYLVGHVVYKVEIDDYGCNAMEAKNYNHLVGHIPDGWGIAKCNLFDVGEDYSPVLAMEYIDGRCGCDEDHWSFDECTETCKALGRCIQRLYDEVRVIGVTDIHPENYILEKTTRTRVLIDYPY